MAEKTIDSYLEDAIGATGKFQIIICAMIFLTKFPVAFQQFNIIFLAPPTTFFCLDDGKNITDKCPCKNIEYDHSIFKSTIITDWGLVCNKSWLAKFTQTILMFGVLVGSFLFGALADRFGRRPPLLATVIIQIASGFLTGVSPNYWLFTFFRFLMGISIGGSMVVGYVLMMEFIGKQYRAMISCLYQFPLTVGHLLIPLVAYYVRDWTYLQYILTAYSLVMIIFYWTLPESARWLLAVGKTDKAIHILENAAKRNSLPTTNIRANFTRYQNSRKKEEIKKGSTLDLFKTPRIRLNTVIMAFVWLVCGFGYYGLSQYIGSLGGNIFMNVALSALMTMPGTIISIPLLNYVGRKISLLVTFFIAGFCLIGFIFVPKSIGWLRVLLAAIGNGSIFITFILIYLYTTEIYPTVVRNAGVGVCSTLARIGSMSAPYIATMETEHEWISPLIFGVAPILGALVSILLPETKGLPLPTTIEEGENIGRKRPDKK